VPETRILTRHARAAANRVGRIRSFSFKGYVIFFRYEGDTFRVVNVLEGHRDIIAYFREDQD
jgi:hypothetical protein